MIGFPINRKAWMFAQNKQTELSLTDEQTEKVYIKAKEKLDCTKKSREKTLREEMLETFDMSRGIEHYLEITTDSLGRETVMPERKIK